MHPWTSRQHQHRWRLDRTPVTRSRPTRQQPAPTRIGRGVQPGRRRRAASSRGTSGQYIPGHGPKAHITVTIDYQRPQGRDRRRDRPARLRRRPVRSHHPPPGLRRPSHPHRPRLQLPTTRRRHHQTPRHRPMRLALNARDKGCVVCGAPPIQCEAHHLVHWIDGGKPPSPTWSCSANATTSTCTPATGTSTSPTASSTSPDPTGPTPTPSHPAHTDHPPTTTPRSPRGRTTAHTADRTHLDAPRPPPDHRETTPDAARQAIWGDPNPPSRTWPQSGVIPSIQPLERRAALRALNRSSRVDHHRRRVSLRSVSPSREALSRSGRWTASGGRVTPRLISLAGKAVDR